MANMHLVTGYAGAAHVTAADQGSLHIALFGGKNVVLNRGNQFAATIVSNNLIRVLDGDLLIQGRHVRLNENTFVDLTIENGGQGYKRNDLIVARYTKNSGTGVEEVNLVVVKGTATTGTAVDPEYSNADLVTDHALTTDFPLWRVPLDGLNVQKLVPLFDVVNPYGDINTRLVDHLTDTPSHVPACNSGMNNQFLRVVNGKPTWATVGNAEGAEF